MRMMVKAALMAVAAASLASTAARADDVFGGFYGHGLGVAGREQDSFDTQIGYRTNRIDWLSLIWKPQIHAIVSVNDKYSTHFAAVGLDWRVRFSEKWYLRPGIGLAYTTGKAGLPAANAPGISQAEY